MKSKMHKNIIVIVSAYSSGTMLAPLFRGRGYPCFHVTSHREWGIKRLRSYYNEKDFINNFIIDTADTLMSVITYLKKYNVRAILPGCESGVNLADTINQYFNGPKNSYDLSLARRNKYFMIDALKKKGVLHAAQYKSSNLKKILQWFQDSSYPRVVLKPLSSSSSDSVFYCSNEYEIAKAFHTIFGAADMYNEINQEVLIQEFLEGDEYIVNTVSCEGLHYVTDIWKGVSHDKSIVSNDSYADLIHPHEVEHKLLTIYVKEVLNALGVSNGPAHSEIKITAHGPCLVETGARLAGKVDFSSVEEIFGYSQVSLTAEALLEPPIFKHRLTMASVPRKYARYIYFSSNTEGLVKHEPNLEKILNIDSLSFLNYLPKKGDELKITSKAFRSPRPGYAYLIADSIEKIEEDYALLRKAERDLYSDIIQDEGLHKVG